MKVLVALANGSEDIEVVTVVDILRRAGACVTLASTGNELEVACMLGMRIVADKFIKDCVNDEWDLICLPGGMPGSEHLSDSVELRALLVKQNNEKKLIGAVCAAPEFVLKPLGIMDDKKSSCCNPREFRKLLHRKPTSDDGVVREDNFIYAPGPGCALKFARALVEALFGERKLKAMDEQLQFDI
jgi:protein deglycase